MKKTIHPDHDLDRILEKVEAEANDHFALFAEVEARFFPTEDLMDIRDDLEERRKTFTRSHRVLILLAAICPAVFLLSFLFAKLDWAVLSLLSFILAPVLFLIFLSGTIILNRKFGSQSEVDFLLQKALKELRRRGSA